MKIIEALKQRTDLDQYNDNKILLFAIELALESDDIHTIAATSLTDGTNDKKCDLLYVDRDLGRAIIAQSYYSMKKKNEAPANKASDLNTAVAWVLGTDISELPSNLQSAAKELRSAIKDGDIKVIEIWYCHNLEESKNVQGELSKVKETADNFLRRNYPKSSVENVLAQEVGLKKLEEWYRSINIPILVSDPLEIDVEDGFEERGDNWTAYATSLSGRTLRDLFEKYGGQLFSANVRGYLGSRRSDKNINNKIKFTAEEEPSNFWAFNNGLTILVRDFRITDEKKKKLIIDGLAIVNGAQTTGALGSLPKEQLNNVKILARFVKCSSKDTITKVILYNNTQNKIEVSDFRSNDPIQDRLRKEFEKIPNALYLGGRRGGQDDTIRRPGNLVPTNTAAQALIAFHQNPNLAYNNKGQIWSSDKNYSRYFNDHLTALHLLLLCFGLLRAIEKKKMSLFNTSEDQRTERDKKQIEFFRQRGSIFLLLSGISNSMEIILGRAIPDKFTLTFSKKLSPEGVAEIWQDILPVALAFVDRLVPALEKTMKDQVVLAKSLQDFASLIEATIDTNQPIYRKFSKEIKFR